MSAVVAIEQYRVDHDITDRRTAIGPEPTDYHETLDWYEANETILKARDVMSPPPRIVEPTMPTIEGPSLDIGT